MNLIQNNLINFRGYKNVAESKLTDEEKTRKAVSNALKYLKENGERIIPEDGQFNRKTVLFDIEGTRNEGRFSVEYFPDETKKQRALTAGVNRKGKDAVTFNFLKSGTKKEILEFLNKKGLENELFATVKDLSDSVDKKY